MFRKIMKSKIHRATVTTSNLNYEGSIEIDESLMQKANLVENEAVWIYNLNNGARFETYVIKGERDSGIIGLNGAAARNVQVGDKIIIVSYAFFEEKELKNFKPDIIIVDKFNKLVKII